MAVDGKNIWSCQWVLQTLLTSDKLYSSKKQQVPKHSNNYLVIKISLFVKWSPVLFAILHLDSRPIYILVVLMEWIPQSLCHPLCLAMCTELCLGPSGLWVSCTGLCRMETVPCGPLSITLALLQAPWPPASGWCSHLTPIKGLLYSSQHFHVPCLLVALEFSVVFSARFWCVPDPGKLSSSFTAQVTCLCLYYSTIAPSRWEWNCSI